MVVERTVRELQGQSCIALEEVAPAKKEIAVTRSFGRSITELPQPVEAVSEFALRAGEKLRRQESLAGQVLVFVHTSPFCKQNRQFSRSITLNDRYGRSAVDFASAGLAGAKRSFVMRQERKTPEYTTRWTEMPVARAN